MLCFSQGLTPYEFVEGMKKKGIRVPGIGHRYRWFLMVMMFLNHAKASNHEIWVSIFFLIDHITYLIVTNTCFTSCEKDQERGQQR